VRGRVVLRRGSRLAAGVAAGGLALGWLVGLAPLAAAAGPLDVVDVAVGADRTVTAVVAAPRELVGTAIPAEAFSVYENGQRRAGEATLLPTDGLDVVLVLDTSGSMRGAPLAAAKVAAVEFINQMPPGVRIGVVGFDATVRAASGFSTDRAALVAAVNNLTARGETSLYDALVLTASHFLSESGPRSAVVVLSDGGDTVSRTSLDETLARLSTVRTDIFAVALATTESNGDVLGRLVRGAGRVVPAGNPAALAGAYDSIASQLVNRYRVRFSAESGGPAEVRIVLDHDSVQAEAVSLVELPARPQLPRPSPEVAASPGFLGGRWTLPVGGAASAVAFGLTGWLVVAGREPRRRLAREYAAAAGHDPGSQLSGLSRRAVAAVDRVIERRGRGAFVRRALDSAGIAMRPAEFVVLALTSAWTAFVAGAVLAGVTVGVAVACLTLAGFRLVVSARTRRRRDRFAEQLGDTLQLMAGSLRTGYALSQALDTVAREAEAPTSEEFRRLVMENRLGRDLADSLRALSERMKNVDFDWVVQAVAIHREVGGDLAEVLDKVGETIRDRSRIRRQVKALSAEGRFSAVVLFLLPFGLAAVLAISNPEYLGELTGRTGGRILLGAAAALMAAGGVWLRALARPQF
jgi:tight adherence protein B